jgi:hypothetical protein
LGCALYIRCALSIEKYGLSDFDSEIYCQNKPKCKYGLNNASNCISDVNNKSQKFMFDFMTTESLTVRTTKNNFICDLRHSNLQLKLKIWRQLVDLQ